jgi:hypothetical protein
MTTDTARIAHVAFAVLGTVLLVVGAGVTVVFGVLAAFLDDACGADGFRPGGAIDCRNAGVVRYVLLITPLVVAPAAVPATWFRAKRDRTCRPRGWAPFAGIGVLAAAWYVAYVWFPAI